MRMRRAIPERYGSSPDRIRTFDSMAVRMTVAVLICLIMAACSAPVDRPQSIPENTQSFATGERSQDFQLGGSISEVAEVLRKKGFAFTGPYSASQAVPTDLPPRAEWVIEVRTVEVGALCGKQETTLFVFNRRKRLIDVWIEGSAGCA